MQLAVFMEASVAVHVTDVEPAGKHEPDGGLQTTVAPGQLSVAAGVLKITTAQPPLEHTFCGVAAETPAGQVIAGG